MNMEKVRKLRAETGAGIVACARALEKSDGNAVKAKMTLCLEGHDIHEGKTERSVNQGLITSYIHHNRKVGAMVEIRCETDFAATVLRDFAKDLCMQVAATNPEFVSRDDVPQERIQHEREKLLTILRSSDKPQVNWDKIIQNRLKKFFIEHCLLDQKSVKDSTVTVTDLLVQKARAVGENIVIKRFCRFQIE